MPCVLKLQLSSSALVLHCKLNFHFKKKGIVWKILMQQCFFSFPLSFSVFFLHSFQSPSLITVTIRSFFKFNFLFYIAMIFVLLFDTYRQTDIPALYCRMQQYPHGLLVSVCGITAGDSDVLTVLNMHTMVTLSGAWGTPCRTCFFIITNAHIQHFSSLAVVPPSLAIFLSWSLNLISGCLISSMGQ